MTNPGLAFLKQAAAASSASSRAPSNSAKVGTTWPSWEFLISQDMADLAGVP